MAFGLRKVHVAWAVALLACLVLLAGASLAYAFDEIANTQNVHPPSTGCERCHLDTFYGCGGACHFRAGATMGKGPHGSYSTTTNRCRACHDVHAAPGSKLLPGATVTGSCYSCHDGTGGRGVYGTIRARGLSESASHSVDSTNVVPGGDAATGGSTTMAFGGAGGMLGCDDCHSPHDSNTVGGFSKERLRANPPDVRGTLGPTTFNRLLRKNPGDSTTTVTLYGSDWCLACHKGRLSGGALHNHPVDASSTAGGVPFYYENVARLSVDTLTGATQMGTMAENNQGYLMPFPRTAQQGTHKPICQQCHEDSRNVGVLTAAGNQGDAATYSVTATDGNAPADNPRFQNFPHETANARFLVEKDDDLCLNCHPPVALP